MHMRIAICMHACKKPSVYPHTDTRCNFNLRPTNLHPYLCGLHTFACNHTCTKNFCQTYEGLLRRDEVPLLTGQYHFGALWRYSVYSQKGALPPRSAGARNDRQNKAGFPCNAQMQKIIQNGSDGSNIQ